ncbi:hypothetical protein Ait01nite_098860 [Actinoplanes italicus]|uniref:Tetratricopeptide repeat protein n=1 Tax=Actinoplanes italicus TaxID=113567 RepID=A0A2T0JEB2_9ACTN|nr:tetratricopeptide repeat protein [Actinoplanes italicus]PRX05995.1 tetratricopeptide repeat protein [Actinoplanes italicus]GIE36841.1 hypothetical protein Ait01nite_098860 [Actinoplanes italicus]
MYEQNVTAVNGFAYGAINADIHVFGSGEPLYLLANWEPEPRSDPDWLRELPSRMLNARRAVVPFTRRDDELADLRRWRDNGPRLQVRWLHGPGGQGKSRLAAHFAAECAATGWKVVTALHGPDADPLQPGSQDLTVDGSHGLLLLIDYADRWRLSSLTWLLKNRLLHRIGVPTRILMLARGLDAWPALCAILDTHQAGTSSMHLPALSDRDDREAMFSVARDRFAGIYRLPGVLPDVPIEDPQFGLTLALHMAALVQVDAASHGLPSPAPGDGLTRYLLNREQLHWRRYGTRHRTMNQTVYTAALTGSLDRAHAVSVLRRLKIGPDPEQALADHSRCYPPDHPRRSTVLEPLYPDRLAEDFLALTVPGHTVDYPAQQWAPPIATNLLTTEPGTLTRSVTFLAHAADRWPHVGRQLLYPLLHRHPELALRAGGTALTTLAGVHQIELELLERLEPLLPAGPHVDLDIAAAAISTALTRDRLAKTTDPATRAGLHQTHATRLANAGRFEQALTATQDAVGIYRQLGAADAATYLPALAGALVDAGFCLIEMGRHRDSMGSSTEAADLYRTLVRADASHRGGLATALDNLGIAHTELNQPELALEPVREALEIRRALAEDQPSRYRTPLAASLINLGTLASRLGRRDDALAYTADAAAIYRDLTATDPDAYLPDLAMALANVATYTSEMGRLREAFGPAREALEIRRRLATANPGAYRPALAASLNSLGVLWSLAGRPDRALEPAEEAVIAYRSLAGTDPAAHEADLAGALTNLGIRRSEAGLADHALSPATEATEIYRRLAGADPATYLPGLAASLLNLAARHYDLDRPREAVVQASESVRILHQAAAGNPGAHLPDLATALTNLAAFLLEAGRPHEAIRPQRRALAIRRRLAATLPQAFLPGVANSLLNLGSVLAEAGRPGTAVRHTREAVTIYRRLSESDPDAYGSGLETALHNLAVQSRLVARRAAPSVSRARRLLSPAVHRRRSG